MLKSTSEFVIGTSWKIYPNSEGCYLYTHTPSTKGGHTGFTLSVCPSVDGIVSVMYLQQILAVSIVYLHISSRNFSRCVACKKIFLQNLQFFEFVILTLSCFDLGSNMNPHNEGILVVLVYFSAQLSPPPPPKTEFSPGIHLQKIFKKPHFHI